MAVPDIRVDSTSEREFWINRRERKGRKEVKHSLRPLRSLRSLRLNKYLEYIRTERRMAGQHGPMW